MHFFIFILFNCIFFSTIYKVYPMHDYNRKYNQRMIQSSFNSPTRRYLQVDRLKGITPRTRRHLRPRDTHNLPPCNEDNLMFYLADLNAINPESIINIATDDEEDPESTCRRLSDNLDAIDDFLGTCRVTRQGLYVQLVKGVDGLYDFLCNSTYGKNFQNYYPCYQALHNDYTSCVGPGDWVEFQDPNQICNAYQDITDCYYVKTAKVCGLKAAKAMKQLNKAVINRVINVRCCNINRNPKVPDAYRASATKQQMVFTLYLVIILVIHLCN